MKFKEHKEWPEKTKCVCSENDYLENGCTCGAESYNGALEIVGNLEVPDLSVEEMAEIIKSCHVFNVGIPNIDKFVCVSVKVLAHALIEALEKKRRGE